MYVFFSAGGDSRVALTYTFTSRNDAIATTPDDDAKSFNTPQPSPTIAISQIELFCKFMNGSGLKV